MSDNQLDTVVKTLVDDIQSKLSDRIEKSIVVHVKNALAAYDFDNKITLLASLKLDSKISSLEVSNLDIEAKMLAASDRLVESIAANARKQITHDIARRIDAIDFQQSLTNAVAHQVERRLEAVIFPENSISFKALNQDEILISGSKIKGGIIENFGSTGVDDRATKCQLTILDSHTVFENNLVAAQADVKGDLIVGGNLVVSGTMADGPGFRNIVSATARAVVADLDQDFFTSFSDIIFDKIRTEGIDLNRVTVAGEEVIVGNKLGNKVIESNLQKLGLVRELRSQGETFLSETVYIASNRVGINNINPGHALSIWDQEVEVVTAKHSQNTAMVGTVRAQDLILTSNGRNNLVLHTDGSVAVEQISIGQVGMYSAVAIPNDDQPQGTIVWNSRPEIGQPIGWVSLGAARWASFGTITA